MQRRFLGLIRIGNQPGNQIDQEVSDTAVMGVFNLRDVLELIVDRFDVTVANSKIDPLPPQADTEERIVVGAHCDTAGMQPGADNNTNGVAGLIELASLLREASLPWCVELVAFTLEEEPHLLSAPMGSAVHAASLRQQHIPVRVMFSLGMIGYFTNAPHSQRFPLPFLAAVYPSQGNFIAIVGNHSQGLVVRQIKQAMRRASSLPVHSLNALRFVPGIDFSDHGNYWQARYHAVMVTDTAFYRNTRYHTEHDTAATLDYERMAMVVQGVYAAVLASAQASDPLQK